MATSTFEAFGGPALRERLKESLRRVGGCALVLLALGLAVSLAWFDWRDPSFNHVTGRAVANPGGLLGARAADLLYQLFGLAGWLLVATVGSWGLRWALGRAVPRPT